MKFYELITMSTLLFVFSCDMKTKDPTEQQDEVKNEIDSIITVDVVEPLNVELQDGEILESEFLALFAYDFSKSYDFGWRYIDSPSDSLIETTEYDDVTDLTNYKVIRTNDGQPFEIDLQGSAHSYKKINGNLLLVTYSPEEISQHLNYYYLNDRYGTIDTGELASNGGDEGYWFLSYGEFSKDNSVYEFIELSGFADDTTEISKDIIYFN